MAKKALTLTEPESQSIPASTGAMVGDPVVLVKLRGASSFTPHLSRDGRARQIVVDGRPCEHVGEAADGTWQYEQRAW